MWVMNYSFVFVYMLILTIQSLRNIKNKKVFSSLNNNFSLLSFCSEEPCSNEHSCNIKPSKYKENKKIVDAINYLLNKKYTLPKVNLFPKDESDDEEYWNAGEVPWNVSENANVSISLSPHNIAALLFF